MESRCLLHCPFPFGEMPPNPCNVNMFESCIHSHFPVAIGNSLFWRALGGWSIIPVVQVIFLPIL